MEQQLLLSYVTPSGRIVEYVFRKNTPLYHMMKEIIGETLSQAGLYPNLKPLKHGIPNISFSAEESHRHKELSELLELEDAVLVELEKRKVGNGTKIERYEVHVPMERVSTRGRVLSRNERQRILEQYNAQSTAIAADILERIVGREIKKPEQTSFNDLTTYPEN